MRTQVSQLLVPAQSPFLHSGYWKKEKSSGINQEDCHIEMEGDGMQKQWDKDL